MKTHPSFKPLIVISMALITCLARAAVLDVPGSYATIQAAVTAASAGDVIQIASGTYVLPSAVTINKANLTIQGAPTLQTTLQATSALGAAVFTITASGVTVRDIKIEKTNKAGPQSLILIQAANATVADCELFGQYVFGDPDVSRATEVAFGTTGLVIQNNVIHGLRQPGYFNGSLASPTTGTIANNLVYGTRGWVIDGANLTLTGNSWGSGNAVDVAILSSTPAAYYPNLGAIATANNDAVMQDQRPGGGFSVVYVDASFGGTSNGTFLQPFKTISAGIPAIVSGGKVKVLSGNYDEQVVINKPATVVGAAAPGRPVINFTGTVSGRPTLFDVTADHVTIQNFEMNLDQRKLYSAIIASAVAPATSIGGLQIIDNSIAPYASSPGASFSSGFYGDTNAIGINYAGKTNYRVSSGGGNVTVSGNTISGRLDSDPLAAGSARFFRSGISMDECSGTFDGNTIQTINHDILARFGSSGTVQIQNNHFNGSGVQLSEQNAGVTALNVVNNTFDGAAAILLSGTAVLRLQNNQQSIPTTVSGNSFVNHNWGISAENYRSLAITGNQFTPGSTTPYRHITINSKSLTGNSPSIVQTTISATITTNTFNNSTPSVSGVGIAFYNHDSDNASFGTFTLTGNIFNSGIANFIVLDGSSGSTLTAPAFPEYAAGSLGSGSGTTMAPWTTNIDASNNSYDTGSGAKLPSAMTQTELFALEDRFLHGLDVTGLGLIRVKATELYVTAGGQIQRAINAATAGDVVNVGPGTFVEDVALNKNIDLKGAGVASTTVSGPIGGQGSTFQISASNAVLEGFKITREGNNTTDWNNGSLNTAGVAIQGQATSGAIIYDNLITGMRTAIDINDSSGHTIRNNVIDDNRTGLLFRNQTDNMVVTENAITNNWTVGILFLDGSNAGVPVQTAANGTFTNNKISGNWYGQIVDRQSGGSLPTPGTNLKNFSGNWFGSATPVISTANSAEPGYALLIPVEFGGTATAPGGQPDICGPASANFDLTPLLVSGTDTNVETSSGRGIYGFQGDFSSLKLLTVGAQVGGSRIQEIIDLDSDGGLIAVPTGTYDGSVSATDKTVTLSAGASPGQVIINGDFILDSNDTLPIEINGVVPGTDYDQWIVNGAVTLGGATITLSGTHIPAVGDSFAIINNDSTEAITGIFNGLPENTVISSFLGSAASAIAHYAAGSGNDFVLSVGPEIVVEQPVGSDLGTGGGSRSFGSVPIGGNGSLTFTIKNVGAPGLTGLGITITGPEASLFTVTSSPVAPVNGPSGSTTFTVQFSPTSTGSKSAVLHIASNDADETSFDINLSGTGSSFDYINNAGVVTAVSSGATTITVAVTATNYTLTKSSGTWSGAVDGPAGPVVSGNGSSVLTLLKSAVSQVIIGDNVAGTNVAMAGGSGTFDHPFVVQLDSGTTAGTLNITGNCSFTGNASFIGSTTRTTATAITVTGGMILSAESGAITLTSGNGISLAATTSKITTVDGNITLVANSGAIATGTSCEIKSTGIGSISLSAVTSVATGGSSLVSTESGSLTIQATGAASTFVPGTGSTLHTAGGDLLVTCVGTFNASTPNSFTAATGAGKLTLKSTAGSLGAGVSTITTGGGALELNAATAVSAGNTAQIKVNGPSGTLKILGGSGLVSGGLTVGTGATIQTQGGAIDLKATAGTSGVAGNWTVGAGTNIISGGGAITANAGVTSASTWTLNGGASGTGIDAGGGVISSSAGSTMTLGGTLDGSGSFAKVVTTGAGTITMATTAGGGMTANPYSQITTAGGALELNTAGAGGITTSTASQVKVTTGAGSLKLIAGGNLSVGAGAVVSSDSGPMTLNSGGTWTINSGTSPNVTVVSTASGSISATAGGAVAIGSSSGSTATNYARILNSGSGAGKNITINSTVGITMYQSSEVTTVDGDLGLSGTTISTSTASKIKSTGIGKITLTATSAASGIATGGTSEISTTTGDLTITSGFTFQPGAGSTLSTTSGNMLVTSSGATGTWNASNVAFNATTVGGNLTLKANAASFQAGASTITTGSVGPDVSGGSIELGGTSVSTGTAAQVKVLKGTTGTLKLLATTSNLSIGNAAVISTDGGAMELKTTSTNGTWAALANVQITSNGGNITALAGTTTAGTWSATTNTTISSGAGNFTATAGGAMTLGASTDVGGLTPNFAKIISTSGNIKLTSNLAGITVSNFAQLTTTGGDVELNTQLAATGASITTNADSTISVTGSGKIKLLAGITSPAGNTINIGARSSISTAGGDITATALGGNWLATTGSKIEANGGIITASAPGTLTLGTGTDTNVTFPRITTTGSGSISLTSSASSITANQNSQITTVDGPLALSAGTSITTGASQQIKSTGTGAVSLDATAGAITTSTSSLIQSTSSTLTINAGTSFQPGTTSTLSSSGNLLVEAKNGTFNTSDLAFTATSTGTGTLTLKSSGAFKSGISSITSNDGNLELRGSSVATGSGAGSLVKVLTGNGTILVKATTSTLTTGGPSTISSVNGNIDLQAGTSITTGAGSGITTTGTGAISLISDSANTITLGANATMSTASSGGITVSTQKDILISANASINVVNGNAVFSANQQSLATAASFTGITNFGSIQSSGSGNITLNGKGGNAASNRGILMQGSLGTQGQVLVSAVGATGQVSLNGATGSVGAALAGGTGIYMTGTSAGVFATSATAGNVALTGTSAATGSGGTHYGIYMDGGAKVVSNSATAVAPVSLTGTSGTGGGTNIGIRLLASASASNTNTLISSDSGSITLNGTSAATGGSSLYGISIEAGAQVLASSPNSVAINLTGVAGSGGASNAGVRVTGSSTIATVFTASKVAATNGSITVNGTGGAGVDANSDDNRGVLVSTDAQILASGSATIAITGLAGGGGDDNQQGIAVIDTATPFSAITAANGITTLNGTGGAGAGADPISNYGVFINTATVSSTGTGTISIKGVEGVGGTTSTGFAMLGANSNLSAATAGSAVTICANQVSIDPTGTNATIAAGSNAVTFKPVTATKAINLGGVDNATQLGLTDVELDRVTAGTLTIGSATAGDVTVSAGITRAAATNMVLTTGTDINLTAGTINTGGGTMVLNASTGTLRPTVSGTDITASLTTISAGTKLPFLLDSKVSETGYKPLKVSGDIDLTGVDLVVTQGSYTPVVNDLPVFTLVDAGGSGAVIGTFVGRPEGYKYLDFFGSNKRAELSYLGGTGNDVVLMIEGQPEIAVNDDGAGTRDIIDGDPTPVVDFGSTSLGLAKSRSFTISNPGSGPLTVTSITATSSGFTVVSPPSIATPIIVAAGATHTFQVELNGDTGGPFNGNVSIESDDPTGGENPFTFPITGATDSNMAALTGTTLNIGVANTGNNALTITVNVPVVTAIAPANVPHYTLVRSGTGAGVWTITDIPGVVTGNGTATLTIAKGGVEKVNIFDATGPGTGLVNVVFLGRGTAPASPSTPQQFEDDFTTILDTATAGAVTFTGVCEFTLDNSLYVSTRRTISQSVSTATAKRLLSLVDGGLTLLANQQAVPTPETFDAITLLGAVKTTGSGAILIKGRAGNLASGQGVVITGSSIAGNGTVICDGTGTISIEGSTSASTGTGSSYRGLQINGAGAEIATTTGDINLTGTCEVVSTGSGNVGLYTTAGNIHSTSGKITMLGKSAPAVAGSNNGIFMSGAGCLITSGGAIELIGENRSTLGNNDPVAIGTATITSTAVTGGSIKVTGTTVVPINANGTNGVSLASSATITAASGTIEITGTCTSQPGSIGTSNKGVNINGSAVKASGTTAVDIKIHGTGANSVQNLSGTSGNYGVDIEGTGAEISAAKGSIEIIGTAGTLPVNSLADTGYGVYIATNAQILSTDDASIVIEGTASTGGDDNQTGVYITDSTAPTGVGPLENLTAQVNISTTKGHLSITGTSGGSPPTSISSNCDGVRLNGAGVRVHSGDGGNITITGIKGVPTTSGSAVSLLASARVLSLGTTGDFSLVGDTMSLASTCVLSPAGKRITFKPFTDGQVIKLGGTSEATGETALRLMSSELSRVTSGTIVVGSLDAGDLRIVAPLVIAAATAPNVNLELVSGGNIVQTDISKTSNTNVGTITTNGTGTVKFVTAGGTVQPLPDALPAPGVTDVTTSTASFGAGTGLAISMNAATGASPTLANSEDANGFRFLNVSGALDITGSDLVITGTYKPTLADLTAVSGGPRTFDIVSMASLNGTFRNTVNDYIGQINGGLYGAKVLYNGTKITLEIAGVPEIAINDDGSGVRDLISGDSGSLVNYGSPFYGQPVTRAFTITNSGTRELTVSGITAPAGYLVLDPPLAPIAVNGSYTFHVQFTSPSFGVHAGLITITNDDVDEHSFAIPVTANVSTFGVDPSGGGKPSVTAVLDGGVGITVNVPAAPNDNTYTLVRSSGTWSGGNVSGVISGTGTNTLVIQKSGVSTVNITDAAGGGSVNFVGKGSTNVAGRTFDNGFNVMLDDAAAGAITFTGFCEFTGTNALSAYTVRDIAQSAGRTLSVVDGDINLTAGRGVSAITGNLDAVTILGTVKTTGKGNIDLSGRGSINSQCWGVTIGANSGTGTVTSTSTAADAGSITLLGTGGPNTGSSNLGYGVYINGATAEVSSAKGDVIITGNSDSTGTGGTHAGIVVNGGAKVKSIGTEAVNITLTGTGAAAASNSNHGVWITGTNTKVTAENGAITIVGTGGGVGSTRTFERGVLIETNAEVSSTGTATINITGTGNGTADDDNTGVAILGATTNLAAKVTSKDGDIVINGNGGGSASATALRNYGILIGRGTVSSTGLATITLNATEGSSVTTVLNEAFAMVGANSFLTSAGSGAVSINANQMSIDVTPSNATVDVGTNIITLSPKTTSRSVGLGAVDSSSLLGLTDAELDRITAAGLIQVQSSSGNVTQSATIDRSIATALELTAGGSLNLTSGSLNSAGGNVTLIADAVSVTSGTVAAGSGTASVKPKTPGTLIGIGSTDVSGLLGLTDGELDKVTAGTLAIGDAASGDISMAESLTRPSATDLILTSAASITVSQLIDSAGGNVSLRPGTKVSPTNTGTDVSVASSGVLAFSNGANFDITVNGTTANDEATGYRQLSVTGGAVDITGTNLVITGSYVPLDGDHFVIVNNNSGNPITGTFNGLAEDDVVSLDFLGSGKMARISYLGGDGNDAEIRVFSNNASLSNLVVTTAALVPAFSPAITSYSSVVSDAITSVTVTPTVTENHAVVTVNGVPVVSGTASSSIPLVIGANVISTVVTAEDNVTTKTYTVTVNRSLVFSGIVTKYDTTPPGVESGTTWHTFYNAFLNNNDRVIFCAQLGPVGTLAIPVDQGTWTMGSTGTLDLMIRAGDSIGGGQTISRSITLPRLADTGVGIVQAVATPTGSPVHTLQFIDNGVDTVTPFAKRTSTFSAPPAYTSFTGFTYTSQDQSSGNGFFAADLVQGGSGPTAITSANDSGVWKVTPAGDVTPVAREGDALPATIGAGLKQGIVQRVAKSTGDIAVYRGQVTGTGVTSPNAEIILKRDFTNLTDPVLVARTDSPADGLPTGVKYFSFLGETVNQSGKTLFWTQLTGTGVVTANNRALFSDRNGSMQMVVRYDDDLSAAFGSGIKLSSVLAYWLLNDGRVVVKGQVKGTGVTTANDGFVAVVATDGTMTKLIREGDVLSDVGGSTVAALQMVDVSPNAGKMAIICSLVGATGDTIAGVNDQVLLRGFTASPGTFDRLMRKGSIMPGGTKTVSSMVMTDLNVQGSTGSTAGMSRLVSETGRVCTVVTFSDSDTGVFVGP